MDSNNILHKVINSTESIFSNIAENYPVLLAELDKGVDAALICIQSFSTMNNSEKDSCDIKLNDFLERSKLDSKQKLGQLDSFKEKNEIFIESISSAMQNYSISQKYIEEIRDISESLKIVSLNALCNAVKAGKGGEGFSVITGNLKSVTENTIEKTAILEKKGADVRSALDSFFVTEKENNVKRELFLSTLEAKVVNSIDTFQSESETIDMLFKKLTDESNEIRQCILKIMEELQQQDLIRQTIDQIILSLEELPSESDYLNLNSELNEQAIDKAVFSLRLINLAVVMIEEVESKIKNTIEVFTTNFGAARNKLEFIQDEKNNAVRRFLLNLKSMADLGEMGSEVQKDAGSLQSDRKNLISLIQKIICHVSAIVEEFSSFNKISGWLQNVAILSRIELSRNLSLTGMKESVDDMSKLVERIQDQISLGEKETISFIVDITNISEDYLNYAGEEMSFLNEFTDLFMTNITKISMATNKVSTDLSTFDFFTPGFRELFDISEKKLDQLKEISEDLLRVRLDLKNREDKVKSDISSRLQAQEIINWAIADDDMNKIIEQFTIFSHKKTAGDVSGLNVEDAALEEGEITLF